MEKFLKFIENMSIWTGRVASYLIYPGTFILVYEVIARYFFGAPTTWAHGLSQRIFAVYFVIGAPYVLYHNGHIRMDIIYSRYSKRTKAIVDLLTSPALLVTSIVLIWFGGDFAWTSIKSLELDATPMHAPVWPIKLWIPVTGFLLLLQALLNMCRDIMLIIKER